MVMKFLSILFDSCLILYIRSTNEFLDADLEKVVKKVQKQRRIINIIFQYR